MSRQLIIITTDWDPREPTQFPFHFLSVRLWRQYPEFLNLLISFSGGQSRCLATWLLTSTTGRDQALYRSSNVNPSVVSVDRLRTTNRLQRCERFLVIASRKAKEALLTFWCSMSWSTSKMMTCRWPWKRAQEGDLGCGYSVYVGDVQTC